MSETEYVRKTQDTLGSLIKKPPLTEKLLIKPPFRFLHDVIVAVMKLEGGKFLNNIFDESELDWQQVNDRDKKVAFLQKFIDCLKSMGYEINAKPSKIVAGQEPEKTNEMLRHLATAVKKSVSIRSTEPKSEESATKRSGSKDKAKQKPNVTVPPSGDKTLSAQQQEATSSAGSNKENKIIDKDKAKTKDKPHKSTSRERQPKEMSKQPTKSVTDKKSSSTTVKDQFKQTKDAKVASTLKQKSIQKESKDKKELKQAPAPSMNTPTKSTSKSMLNGSHERVNDVGEKATDSRDANHSNHADNSKGPEIENHAPETNNRPIKEPDDNATFPNEIKTAAAKVDNQKSDILIDHDSFDDPGTTAIRDHRRMSIRDQRPALSAVETRTEQNRDMDNGLYIPRPGSVLRQTMSARPSSAASRTGRPPTANRREPIVRGLNKKELTDYEGQNTKKAKIEQAAISPFDVQVIKEASNDASNENDDFIIDQDDDDALGNFGAEQSSNDINVGDDNEHGQLVRKILETKKDLENQIAPSEKTSLVVYDPGEKEKTKKECAKTQEHIQQLTKNTLLMSKLADFLRDDVESMLVELKQWRDEYRRNMNEIKRELGKNNNEKETLQEKLDDMNNRIGQQMDIVAATKGRLHKGQEKIDKMIAVAIKR